MTQMVAIDSVSALERKHRDLDQQVRVLERRAFLTPNEQRKVQDLKKRKLVAKDELYRALKLEAKSL